MIYTSRESAERWAAIMNAERGHPPAYAIETACGWTVVRTYRGKAHAQAAYGI